MTTAFVNNSSGWLIRVGDFNVVWWNEHQAFYVGYGTLPVMIL